MQSRCRGQRDYFDRPRDLRITVPEGLRTWLSRIIAAFEILRSEGLRLLSFVSKPFGPSKSDLLTKKIEKYRKRKKERKKKDTRDCNGKYRRAKGAPSGWTWPRSCAGHDGISEPFERNPSLHWLKSPALSRGARDRSW